MLALASPLALPSAASAQTDHIVDLAEGWHLVIGEAPDERAGSGDAVEAAASVSLADGWAQHGLADAEGVIWFRKRLTTAEEPALGWSAASVLLGPMLHGSYQVYADGVLVGRHGGEDNRVPTPQARLWRLPEETLSDGAVQLAVRIDRVSWATRAAGADRPVFQEALLGPRSVLELREHTSALSQQRAAVPTLLFALLAAVAGLYHLLLFTGRREERPYLWFGLAALCFAVNAIAFSPWTAGWFERFGPPYRLTDAAGHLAAAFMISFFWGILDRPQGVWLRRYRLSHLALAALVLVMPFRLVLWSAPVRFAWLVPVLVIGLALLYQELRKGHPDARTISIGALALAVGELGELARLLGAPLPDTLPYFGFLALLGSMVVALANRFSRVHSELDALRVDLEDRVASRTAALVEMERAARTASEAKSRFLATMSHELRTPLNSVIGFSGILMKRLGEDISPRDQDFLSRIRSSGEHLLAVINDVLDISRIEAGKMTLSFREVDLESLVHDTLAELHGLARVGRVQLIGLVPPDIDTVRADAVRLKQILVNLVGNALKFTNDGSVVVRVTAEGGRPATIEVIDTGDGIPSEHIDRIMEAFEQLEGGTTRPHEGTGLGLTIVRDLCAMLGYEFSLESRVGEGTTARLDLRGAAPHGALPRRPAARPAVGAGTPSATPSSGTLVLVIDDDPDARQLLRYSIEAFGSHVVTAKNGEEGLHMAGRLRPDLVTLDLRMPGMDGWAVLKALKADEKLAEIPVVVISVAADEQAADVLGEMDMLAKPIRPDALEAVLARHLAARPRRVLVVDDDVDARLLMMELIRPSGPDVRAARDGREALKLLDQWEPGLILLDLDMPEMDGFEFLRRLRTRERHRSTPVIVVSSWDLSTGERQLLERETQGVVRKAEPSRTLDEAGKLLSAYLSQN